MDFSLWDILILVSLGQGMAFGMAVLLSRSFRVYPNKYLAYSIMMISTIGFNEWLSQWNFDEQYYFIDFFGDDLPWILLFYVPLLLYFLKKVEHPWRDHKIIYLLYLPFILYSLFNLTINLDVDFDCYSLPSIKRLQDIVYTSEFYLALLYSITLCCLSYFVIQRGETEKTVKDWLMSIWLFSALIIGLWLVAELIIDHSWSNRLHYIIWLGISLFFYWLIFRGIYQLQLKQKRKAEKNLTRETVIFQKLEEIMLEKQLYKNPDLSRDQVASALDISPGYLSQIVNSVTNNNFTFYINSLRVKEVQQMLLGPSFEQYSLWALGMEAGFKSKSTFYAVFKKMLGMTPSEYQKSKAKQS